MALIVFSNSSVTHAGELECGGYGGDPRCWLGLRIWAGSEEIEVPFLHRSYRFNPVSLYHGVFSSGYFGLPRCSISIQRRR